MSQSEKQFSEIIKDLAGLDLIVLKNQKETELAEIQLEMIRRIKDAK